MSHVVFQLGPLCNHIDVTIKAQVVALSIYGMYKNLQKNFQTNGLLLVWIICCRQLEDQMLYSLTMMFRT